MRSSLDTLSSTISKDQGRNEKPRDVPESIYRLAAFILGATLGLSAPGLDQWYLAWFGLVPAIYLSLTAKEPWQAGVRGFYFFWAYNLVYMSWYLFVRPEFLCGRFTAAPVVMTTGFWILMTGLQGLFSSIFCCILNALPLTGGWLPARLSGRWFWPSFIVVPALFVILDRLCNCPGLLGVPWSALEYSQYKQLFVIQAASIVGGSGITFFLVLANLTLLSILRVQGLSQVTCKNKKLFAASIALSIAFLVALPLFGHYRLEKEHEQSASKKTLTVCAVQAGLCPRVHKVPYQKIYDTYVSLSRQCPPRSVVIWPEWSFLVDFTKALPHLKPFAQIPLDLNQTWLMGCIDNDDKKHLFNSIMAVDRKLGTLPRPYHKRVPVPFGEFAPDWVKETPLYWILYGFDNFDQSTPDARTTVFSLTDLKVGPLLCFECLFSRLSRDNVREGAQLLIDCSNTSWFFKSILSDQLVAFCVMRAAETHRSLVFSTTLGPSTIIDSSGRILVTAPREKAAMIEAKVPIETDITPYLRFGF